MSSSKLLPDQERWLRLTRRYLRFGTRSTAQARAYLRSRGAADRAIQQTIAYATQHGWLDDRACGRVQAVSLADRGFSDAAIHRRLIAQGLDERLVGRTLQALRAEADEATRARRVVDERLARRRAPAAESIQRRRGRLARLLSQRGFDPELIEQVLLHALPDTQ